jgi:hypothetical protein
MTDLFAPAVARRTDPETSHQAARAINPQTESIRRQVEGFAFSRGERGFIDEELSAAFDASDSSSYRTRRAELTEVGTICDSGQTRKNEGGRQCIIWVHRAFCNLAPLVERLPKPSEQTKSAARQHQETLEDGARQMRAEGRMAFSQQLMDAANFLRGLSA